MNNEVRKERVQELINERFNGKKIDFARAIGKATAQVSHWLTDQRVIGNGVASDIEKALDLPRGWLDGETAADGLPAYRSEVPVQQEGWLSVPRLAVVGELGGGIENDGEDIVDYVVIAEDWAQRVFGGNLHALRIVGTRGDSMQGTINPGDIVFIDTSADRYDGAGIYAVLTTAGLRIKRLQALVSGGLRIISDNKAYGDETLSAQELEHIRICGRVKGSWSLNVF